MRCKIMIEDVRQAISGIDNVPRLTLGLIVRYIGFGDVGELFKLWKQHPEVFKNVAVPNIGEYEIDNSYLVDKVNSIVFQLFVATRVSL